MTTPQSALLPQREPTHRRYRRHPHRIETRSAIYGIVHVTDRGESGPLVHQLTVRRRPKCRDTGRPLPLGPLVTNAYQAAKLLGPLLAPEAAEVFGVLCLTARSRVIGWCEISRGSVNRTRAAPCDVFRVA